MLPKKNLPRVLLTAGKEKLHNGDLSLDDNSIVNHADSMQMT